MIEFGCDIPIPTKVELLYSNGKTSQIIVCCSVASSIVSETILMLSLCETLPYLLRVDWTAGVRLGLI